MISFFIIDLIIGIGFWVVFRKFDVKSQKQHGERFAILTLIPMILVTLLSFAVILTSDANKNRDYVNLDAIVRTDQ